MASSHQVFLPLLAQMDGIRPGGADIVPLDIQPGRLVRRIKPVRGAVVLASFVGVALQFEKTLPLDLP